MPITAIFAQLSCTELNRSRTWFASLFGQDPSDAPMDKLLEWHRTGAGFQLFEDGGNAGRGAMTIIVSDIRSECDRLKEAGLEPGAIEDANYTVISQLRDPDQNLVVLAQPR